ncbi:MAG: hypothetical protein CM15mP120_04610 [Pseudomonadota bacterium]|nr:MAG: hypothetical protein CM15mP120_04610 [Pseudomonadota bacterium]
MALELSGGSLDKVAYTFRNITGTDTNDELRALQTQIYPLLTRESDAIRLSDALYQRVKAVFDARDTLDLDEQQARLLELTHRGFVRAGAALAPRLSSRSPPSMKKYPSSPRSLRKTCCWKLRLLSNTENPRRNGWPKP